MPAKGSTSIVISAEKCDKLKQLAELRNWTAAQLIEYLIDQYELPEKRALIDGGSSIGPTKLEWMWPGPYRDVVLDPRLQKYLSTSWVRTAQYISKAAGPLWAIDKRIRDETDFILERVFVLSRESWGSNKAERRKGEVWKWISKWLSYRFAFGEKVKLFVLKEKVAMNKLKEEKYFDMGIYGKELVGFLKLDDKSNPESYTWLARPDDIDGAIRCFQKLKDGAIQIRDFEDLENLLKQNYD